MSGKIRIFILFYLIAFLSGGCSLLKRTPKNDNVNFSLVSAVQDRIDNVKNTNYILIENADLEVIVDKKRSAKITVYAEKEEFIFASVRYLGFELARFMVTNDSLKYLNRMNREYLFESLNKLDQGIVSLFDFDIVQNILFTGFVEIPKSKNHDFYRDAELVEDSVIYKFIVEEGTNIILDYNFPEMLLQKISYTDHKDVIRSEVNVERKMSEIKSLSGYLQKDLLLVEYKLDVGNITNRSYSKTDFKIGRNYKKVEDIF